MWDDLVDSYLISFDSQGGSPVGAIIGAAGSPVTLPEPTWAGYIFGGWYDNQACVGDPWPTATTMPAHNVQLYAKWTARTDIPYIVRHYQQTVAGSEYLLVAADTETLAGTAGTEVTPAVKNYPGFKAPAAQTVRVEGDGTTVVEYKYDRNSYLLTFMPENGDDPIEKTVVYGASIAPPQPTWPGYAFDAWCSDAGLSTVYTFSPESTMPAEPLTLYARWTLTALLVEINTQPSSRFDGIALMGDLVHDTIILTWNAPPGVVPTGSVIVTMRTPGGVDSVIYNQVIAATSSPLVITTADQYLGELGLYQFKAEYIKDEASVFASAVSHFYQEPVAVAMLENPDAPQYAPGVPLPASPVVGTLEGPYWEAADFRDWYDVSLAEGDLLTLWITGWTGPWTTADFTVGVLYEGAYVGVVTVPYPLNPDPVIYISVPSGGAGVYSLLVETVGVGGMYAFEYTITPATGP
jgi:uncharacterized repeat protein (TIGR02543 family)